MAILAVFHNFFGYYQNAEKLPFLQNFLCNILLHMQRDFCPSYTLYIEIQCPPHKDKKTKIIYLSAVEIRLISHFKALLSHCRNSCMILRPPLETLLGPLKSQIDSLPFLPYFQKLGNSGLFCAMCTINCIIVVIQ